MQKKNNLLPHLVALTVVIIWGSTFVFTKLLLLNGLSAAQIFLLRFILAYAMLLVWSISSKGHRWFCKSLKDEFKMLLLGISGGSLYFLAENSAMNYTTATNDSLIVCACPLFTTLIVALFYKSEHISGRQLLGTLIALVGMAVVVMNGQFVLQLSPKGDLLAFTACMCWVVYSLLMMNVGKRYPSVFTTRKVFFYGLVSIIPYFIAYPGMPSLSVLAQPDVLFNLLFRGKHSLLFTVELGFVAHRCGGDNELRLPESTCHHRLCLVAHRRARDRMVAFRNRPFALGTVSGKQEKHILKNCSHLECCF